VVGVAGGVVAVADVEVVTDAVEVGVGVGSAGAAVEVVAEAVAVGVAGGVVAVAGVEVVADEVGVGVAGGVVAVAGVEVVADAVGVGVSGGVVAAAEVEVVADAVVIGVAGGVVAAAEVEVVADAVEVGVGGGVPCADGDQLARLPRGRAGVAGVDLAEDAAAVAGACIAVVAGLRLVEVAVTTAVDDEVDEATGRAVLAGPCVVGGCGVDVDDVGGEGERVCVEIDAVARVETGLGGGSADAVGALGGVTGGPVDGLIPKLDVEVARFSAITVVECCVSVRPPVLLHF